MSHFEAPCQTRNGSKWAILVGIDHYPGIERSDLKGCVHDVRKTKEMLCGSYGYQHDQVLQLTSPKQPDMSPTKFAPYLEDSAPSYDNIISSFRAVRKMGVRGDTAYIHFSGYVLPDVPSLLRYSHRHRNSLDSAVAPVGVLQDGKYLHDLELALLHHELVTAGIGVTIIVDGRFALYRGKFELHPSRSSAFAPEEIHALPYDRLEETSAYTWLRSPDPGRPYALLWRISSWEHHDLGSKEWNGVLTSWLHRFLQEHGPYVKFRFLWQNLQMEPIRATVWDTYMDGRDQVIAAGSLSQLFPVSDQFCLPWSPTFPALLQQEGNRPVLKVDGGAAHGIEIGTRLIAISQSSSNPWFSGREQRVYGMFSVTNLYGLSSIATPLLENTPQVPEEMTIRARLVSGETIQDESTTNSKPETAGNPLLPEIEGGATFFLNEPLSPSKQADLYRKILLVKRSPSKLSNDANVIVVGGHRHGSSPSMQIYPDFDKSGHLNLLSGDFVTLYIHSRRHKKLFVNVLSFDSAFGITHVYPHRNTDTSSLGSPDGDRRGFAELSLCLRVGFPAEVMANANSQLSKSSEILRVFVTEKAASFESLELPRIRVDSFLRENPDPAGTSTNSSLLPHSEESLANDITNMKVSMKDIDEKETAEDAWCFFDARIVIHRTEESLGQLY